MSRHNHHHHQVKPFQQPEAFLTRVPISVESIDCSLCFETTSYVGVGACGHAEICWLCSLRLRWICKDSTCAICKESSESLSVKRIGDLSSPPSLAYRIRDVDFCDPAIKAEAERLLSYCCPYTCADDERFHFRSLSDLQTHLKRDHDSAVFCSICLDYRRCFLPEQQLFGPTDLATHTRAEHPCCEFCSKDRKFYSFDELLAHMHQAHFKCIVCDRLDHRNEYYANFDSLDRHFEEAHYRCEYPECREQRFVVFAEEEDLRLHWLEKHGRGRAIHIGRSTSGTPGTFKKTRNKNSNTPAHLVIHFRGPRLPNHAQDHVIDEEVRGRYPDIKSGNRYDKRIHSALPSRSERPTWMTQLAHSLARAGTPVGDAYKADNVAFLKRLTDTLSEDQVKALKQSSVAFAKGQMGEASFFAHVRDLIPKDDQLVSILTDLIRLMPDQGKRSLLIQYVSKPAVRAATPKSTQKTAPRAPAKLTAAVNMPDQLFEPGSKKPCLIQALNAILESTPSPNLPQAVLAAMENKVTSLDRVQLSTLSEMRGQLLTLAEARVKDLSWAQVDSILALRPLLYRLMLVPDTHRSRERELISSGWADFVTAAQNALAKFSPAELQWMKAYIALSVMRLGTIGLTETRRQDFPSLPMSAYFPTVEAAAAPAALPTRADFPVGLPMAPPVVRLVPTAASTGQWQNSRQALREEAFPELAPSHAPPPVARADVARPWNCPRCTFHNTRVLSTNCEICGMERPPPGQETSNSSSPEATSSVPSTSAGHRRTKQRILLSSATQRDYKR